MTIQDLARQYADLFVTKERDNRDKFLCVEDHSNIPLMELIRNAHDEMMPDDYKYQFIHEALEGIAESDDTDDIGIEADIYNSDLLKWVSSNLTRASYVDRAIAEIDGYDNLWQALSNGQYLERYEILHSVISSLESIIEKGVSE